MFPIAKSVCLLKAAINPVVNSGKEVPTATMVIPIIVSEMPKSEAIEEAPKINRFDPRITPIKPPTKKIIANHTDKFFSS